jgi:hypothetical protein
LALDQNLGSVKNKFTDGDELKSLDAKKGLGEE